MTLEEIRQLVELVRESSIAELEIGRGDDRIRIVRQHQQPAVAMSAAMPVSVPSEPASSAAEPAAPAAVPASDVHEIKAPMVGTFYRAPAPDAPPFVEVGDRVVEDQTICIIEAMKLMNEIPTDRAGTIVEIVGQNAQPVEYGQPLVRIKPD